MSVILIRRLRVRPFTRKQIALLKTFADQAAMAIENARLLNETKEMLEQQSATGDILRVISRSPTDVQPVFDTIAACAKRVCDARECAVFRFDGELIHLVALADTGADWAHALRSAFPRRPGRGMVTARAIQTGSLVHVPDVLADPALRTVRLRWRKTPRQSALCRPPGAATSPPGRTRQVPLAPLFCQAQNRVVKARNERVKCGL